jgi:MoaA/NifB/PqqE/SkfB family radical SAM enzyme
LLPTKPLDHPTPERPHRVYAALTNHCNRSCPWCSTCSSPRGTTFLTLGAFHEALPADAPFEVQLEGGEPTLHPRFSAFVHAARTHPSCTRLVVVTNGVRLPRREALLRVWAERLGVPLTLKLSVNHHLLARDEGLLDLAATLRNVFDALGGDRRLVLNVRLRKGVAEDEEDLVGRVRDAGLLPVSNVFFLQRYGFADGRAEWDAPFLVGTNFSMLNPDGRVFGPDLVARSDAMRELP